MNWEEKEKKYDEIRKKAEELYKSFVRIQCPALGNEWVYFTSEGFNHLIYPENKKLQRNKRAQIMRFELLEKAKVILEKSTTFQEFDEDYKEIMKQKQGAKYQPESTLVTSWGFVAVIKKFRIKVVVIQKGSGKNEFHSVIPAWFVRQYRDIKLIDLSTKGGLLCENEEEVLKNATKFEGDVI